ncbi:MAG: (4Fe-4S)-binding protein [Chloroflexi bacterium]|nr:(4Fe-4S)-binding protein [Chloroflexota bacterium]
MATKKKIRLIKIDADKCSGCRACEAICSAYHNDSLVNPKRSRIRVFWDEANDLYVPILAGPYTQAECNGRHITVVKGKEYDECSFCRASCPSRDLFKEPDSALPLKCDMCGEPPLPEPMCVKWCLTDALTYVEREEEEE